MRKKIRILFRKLSRVFQNTNNKHVSVGKCQKIIISVLFIFIELIIFFSFGIYHLCIKNYFEAILYLAISLILIIRLLLIKYIKHELFNIFNLFLVLLIFMFFIYKGGKSGEKIYWLFLFPILSVFALGKKRGLILCGILLGGVLVLFSPIVNHFFSPYQYNLNVKIRVIIIFIVIFILSYIIEYTKEFFQNGYIEKNNQLKKANKRLAILSKTDTLTNLLNRRAFFETIEKKKNIFSKDNLKTKRRRKSKRNISLLNEKKFTCMFIDIDHFKKINDKYGHQIGDDVLKKIGELLCSNKIFRKSDIRGRYGGEEFIVILPDTNAQYAKKSANRLKDQIKQIVFLDNNKRNFHVSISIGISEFKLADTTYDDVIKRADMALYQAKEKGKDMVIVYNEVFKKNKDEIN